jgi:hypothetical protein
MAETSTGGFMADLKKGFKGPKNDALMNWLELATDAQVKATGASRSHLRLIAYGHRKTAPEYAAMIEAATQGLITRQQLRPDDWKVIWPELKAA